MAISRVAVGSLYSSTVSDTAITLNRPTGSAADDLMIAFVVTEQNSTVSVTGWTVVRTMSIDDGSDDIALFVLKRTFVAGDPASWGGTVSVASTRRMARVVTYRGADTAANQFVVENGANSTADTPLARTTPVVTNTDSGAWRIACFAAHDNAVGTNNPYWSDYVPTSTELFDDLIGGTTDPILSVAVADSNGTAGAGSASATATWHTGGSGTALDTTALWIGFIKPAPVGAPSNNPITYGIFIDWDNDGSVLAGSPTTNEDVSANVLGLRTPLSWAYGRDTARSLSEIQPGSVSLELDNRTKLYSPDNVAGALYGKLGPGRMILITATMLGVKYNLFWGFLDEYSIDPAREVKSVKLTAMDVLGKLAETVVSTDLYQSLQTGDAINVILDAAGWSSSLRNIDRGATTVRWFWAEQRGAVEVIKELIASEGGPAVAYVDANCNFVFKDRHHRFTEEKSVNTQASFTAATTEPTYCAPVDYNIGFRDLINSVTFSVDEREAQPETVVWESKDSFSIASGDTLVLHAKLDDPVIDAVVPVAETDAYPGALPDYVLVSGSVSISLSSTSGQSVDISITASSASYITGMRLRAKPITVVTTYTILAEDSASIAKYGRTSYTGPTPAWVGRNDADSIAEVMLANRSERLPVISITVNNGNDLRKAQILTRQISDRIHIKEDQTGTDHDHFIERIDHSVNDVGKDHRVQYGCERVRTVPGTQFTFDKAGAGFDDGSFGLSGYDDASTIFILGSVVSTHWLGTGKLAT